MVRRNATTPIYHIWIQDGSLGCVGLYWVQGTQIYYSKYFVWYRH